MLLVGVRDQSGAGNTTLYVNGSVAAVGATAGNIVPSTNTPTVGYHTSAGRPAIGGVGGMAYSETVLTLEEVLAFSAAALLAGDIVDPGAVWEHYWTGAAAAGAPATWTSVGTVGGVVLTRQGAPTQQDRLAKWY
jgi:hypothetical protein